MSSLLYNPGQKGKQELISEFVVRQDIYEEIMLDLESSSMKHPEQHYLLVGQRGMGKTTLLLRLQYGIEDSTILKDKLLPVAFPEEQYQISELSGLWEYVAEYLEDRYGFSKLYEEIVSNARAVDFQEKSYDLLEVALKESGKHLVLLIDNIGDFFHKLDNKEIRRLREVLQTNNRIRVIGGSTNYIEEVLDYHQPFYEFFKIIRLDGLGKSETNSLILRLGEMYGEQEKIQRIVRETPGRIETLRILTGGVPRTISIMFGIFLDNEHENALKDLHKILDLVTPLYKHRMDDLPMQQQKIVDAVAKNWEPITVKELAAKTRLISKTLSAQLNQLEKEQIIVKHDTANRNKTYMVRERFWNIWYLMRYGKRDDKEKVIWLVKFLESWLSNDDLKQRIESFVAKVKRDDIDEDQLRFFSKVYAELKNLPPGSKAQLKSIEKETREEINMSDEEWLTCAREAYEKENYYDSLLYMIKVQNIKTMEWFVFLGELGIPKSLNMLEKRVKDLLNEVDAPRLQWALRIILALKLSARAKSNTINYESLIEFLEASFEWEIINSEYNTLSAEELSLSLAVTAQLIMHLISAGLYNTVYKLLDETSVNIEGKIRFIKDKWKPFYLAVKYLYQPEELKKQPSEQNAAAFSLIKMLMGIISVPVEQTHLSANS